MRANNFYELFEHTADIGIRIKAKDLKALFKAAALAMFDVMAESRVPGAKRKKEIKLKQRADTPDELFINWLNELLSLSSAKGLIFSDFKINKLEEKQLQAVLIGSGIENYKVNTEIKAATYHALKLEKTGSGWLAEVIFDV